MLKRCGLIFAFFLSYCGILQAGEDPAFDLDKIVVTKEGVHLSKAYSIKSDTLQELPIASAIEALSTLPIDLQSRSPKAAIQTDFSLRGSNFQEVLMLFQGQRINDPQTAHHNSDIPITKEDVERIDLLPGVSSAVFGPDSISGAVNFILKKPQERKIIFESSGGQHKTWSGLFSATERIGNLGARLSVENQSSGGFYTDTDFRKLTSTFNSTLEIPDGEYNLAFGYQEKEFGAYDFYTPASGYQSKEWTKTFLLNTGLSLERGGLLIKPNFLWRRHYDKFLLDRTLLRSRYLNHSRTNMFTPNIYLQKEIGFLGKAGLGLEYSEEKINSVFLGKHSRNHKSIFMDESKDISDNLSFGASFRADDFSATDLVYTGSVSARYSLSETKALRFGVSRSTRIPSFTELYYSDPTTIGNTALSNEKSMNYQAGFDYKKNKISLGSTIFFRREDDFIDWVKSTPAQAKWQAQNVDRSDNFGIENQLKIDINRYLTLDSNYTFINKRNSKRGYVYKYGPNYAKHLLNSELLVKLPFGTQSIGFTVKKKPDRREWFLLNARLSYNLNKRSSVFLNATNLCNVEYQEIEGIPSPDRWVEGGFRLEW
jgi:iron complex outermembrane receptor protein